MAETNEDEFGIGERAAESLFENRYVSVEHF